METTGLIKTDSHVNSWLGPFGGLHSLSLINFTGNTLQQLALLYLTRGATIQWLSLALGSHGWQAGEPGFALRSLCFQNICSLQYSCYLPTNRSHIHFDLVIYSTPSFISIENISTSGSRNIPHCRSLSKHFSLMRYVQQPHDVGIRGPGFLSISLIR